MKYIFLVIVLYYGCIWKKVETKRKAGNETEGKDSNFGGRTDYYCKKFI